MQIDKQAILDFLHKQGDQPKVEEADQALPQQVDHERDAGLLRQLGIDPDVLVKQFMGGSNIPGL